VLSEDPARVEPGRIGEISVVATVVGGVPAFGEERLDSR
jgi:hypothetical protein